MANGFAIRCELGGPVTVYLRFVVADIDESTGRELGLFHAVRDLRETGKLQHHE